MPDTAAEVRIGGFVPLTTVDWPERLAAVVFLRGCPWSCPYCHNPHLLERGGAPDDTRWADVLAFLRTRTGLLDGVVFSGGEPTAQAGLADAVDDVRALGFAAALHTGGQHPGRLAPLLPALGWIGFDFKAPFDGYARVTGAERSGEPARESLRAIVGSGVPYEVRTTVHPDLLDGGALTRMAEDLAAEGVRHWTLQRFRAEGVRAGMLGPAGGSLVVPRRVYELLDAVSVR